MDKIEPMQFVFMLFTVIFSAGVSWGVVRTQVTQLIKDNESQSNRIKELEERGQQISEMKILLKNALEYGPRIKVLEDERVPLAEKITAMHSGIEALKRFMEERRQ